MNIRAGFDRVPQDGRNGRALVQSAPSRGNSRKGDRHRLVDEKVRITHNGASHEAELINVSGGGAMVAATFDANIWDLLELHLGENGTIECAVRWLSGGRIGLEFAHETQLDCSAEAQAVLLREVIDRTYGGARFGHATAREETRAAPDEEEAGSEHRRAKRHPLIWSGTLHCGGSASPVRVRNISSTGAMVQSTAEVRTGAEAVLELSDSVSVTATVGWAVGDQIGLRFHAPFDMSKLARSTPKVAPTRWVRPAYLNEAKAPASPWDPKWQRLSLGEINQELEGFLKR